MDPSIGPLPSANIPERLHFQSMEEFDRECEQREAVERAKMQPQKKVKGPPPSKKQKKTVDTNALAAEAAALEEMGEMNWIGKLNEYRSVNPVKVPVAGPPYKETPLPQDPMRHTCIAIIPESVQKFGEGFSFSNKKNAKKYASKKAIDWLITHNYMPADGTVKFPKVQQLPQLPPKPNTSVPPLAVSVPSPAASISSDAAKTKSWASQVPELCTRLGYDIPTYEITKTSETEAFYSGYAHFGGDPRIVGKFGPVQNVYGQKRAKEEIAKELVSFLKDIERQRLEQHEIEERKRKRSSDSSQQEEPAEEVVKMDG